MASANISSGVAARLIAAQHAPPASPSTAVAGASPRNSTQKSNARSRSVGVRGASSRSASATPVHRTVPPSTVVAASARGACQRHRTSMLVALRGNAAGAPRTRCRAATISSLIASMAPGARWHGSGSIVLSTARCTGSGPFSLAKISAEVTTSRGQARPTTRLTGAAPLLAPPQGRQAGRSVAPTRSPPGPDLVSRSTWTASLLPAL